MLSIENIEIRSLQDLLWQAAVAELKKEKEQHRIDYHTTRMFPDKKDAPDHNTWLKEMSEGVDVLAKKGVAVVEQKDDDGKTFLQPVSASHAEII